MSITKKPNGRFQVSVYNEYGERIRKTFKLQSEAKAFENKVNQTKYTLKLENNGLLPVRFRLDEALNEFLSSKQDLRPKSYRKYASIIEQFKIFAENGRVEYLSDFTDSHASRFQTEIMRERKNEKGEIVKPSSQTVNFYIMIIRSFFKAELKRKRIASNPFDGIPNLRAEKKVKDYYTEAELESFFSQDMEPVMKNIFTVFLHAGLRFAELANLKVSNIDLKNNIMSIRSTEEFRTKTFKSQRDIPLNETLIKLFTEILKGRNPDEYVFMVNGKQLSERLLLRYCKEIGNKAGIKSRIYLHKFRHTFATTLTMNGCRVEITSKLLGHASLKDTMIYTHLESGKFHEETKILDQVFPGNKKEK